MIERWVSESLLLPYTTAQFSHPTSSNVLEATARLELVVDSMAGGSVIRKGNFK